MRLLLEPDSVRAMRLYAAAWIAQLHGQEKEKFLPEYSKIMHQQRGAITAQDWRHVHSQWNWLIESIKIYVEGSL